MARATTRLAALPPNRCRDCPLRVLPNFVDLAPEAVAGLQDARVSVRHLGAGATLYAEGDASSEVSTLFDGWAFRYKTTEDGRRQILDFAVPGSFFGLAEDADGNWNHAVEALTPVSMCILSREKVSLLIRTDPAIAGFMAGIGRSEQAILYEHLCNIGQRSAVDAVAHLLLELRFRWCAHRPDPGDTIHLPLGQAHIADALGLSHVHANRVLMQLKRQGLISFSHQRLSIPDIAAASERYGYGPQYIVPRPLL